MSLVHKCCCSLVVLIVLSWCCVLVQSRSYNNGLIFYDLVTKQTFLPPTVSVSRGRGLANVKFSEKGSIWSTFGKPCDCAGPLCGCCVGIKVKQYNFDQKMCANVSYVQPKEEINLEVFLNEKQSAKYAVSARNPSPFCIPVMVGVPMSMCVQLSNVGLQGNNMNACMDYIVQLASTQLFEMHFQCMQMGLEGVQWVNPAGGPVIPPGSSKITDRSDSIYDEYYDEEEQNEFVSSTTPIGDKTGEVEKEEYENKAQEELDYDFSDELTEGGGEGEGEVEEQENIKDNEVVFSEEKQDQVDKGFLSESVDLGQLPLMSAEQSSKEVKTSVLVNDEIVADLGEMPLEANHNESNFNKPFETTTETMEMKMTVEQQGEHDIMDNIKPTMATTTMGYNDIDNIDNALTTATIMTTTTIATTTSTTKTPTVVPTETTQTTSTAPDIATVTTTSTALIENNDSDNGQNNDSDYKNEESDEAEDASDEEEEEDDKDEGEDGVEKDKEETEEDPDELEKHNPHTTAANVDENANAAVASQDQQQDTEYESEEDDSEAEEAYEDYEEIENTVTVATSTTSSTITNTNESQLLNNGFIAATTMSTAAVTPEDMAEPTKHKTDEQNATISNSNSQLSSTDAMLSTLDANINNSTNTVIGNNNSDESSATVANNNVNMSEITDTTVTPLTRARKLLPLRQHSHSQQQQKWQYQRQHLHQQQQQQQQQQQLHHRLSRHHHPHRFHHHHDA